jgi:2-succinyl-6-hydroxy-2,4-cyclohexadiene-1-carboxylate synthase
VIGVRRFGSGPPLVALHGFTLTGEQFASASSLLGRTIIAPDLPGHGRNSRASTKLVDVIDFVASTVESVGSPAPVVGYSQGARLALLTALNRPVRISALVLISANAGIEDMSERASRARADAEVASRLTTMTIDEFLDTWTSAGITSTEHLSVGDRDADRAIRRQNSPIGLADAVTGYGQGAQPSVWHRLEDLTMPVLVMSGTRDEKYSIIADAIASMIPDVERMTIDHAGHNPLLDTPDQAYGAISDFLDRRG